ncbi:MAG: HTH domain-containing protein [Actinomycetes bacterium]|jgi:predicted DNA-binding transcriptional regulator YafY|nr:MAG: hypothetical protein DIU60_19055 [Actinomycetota bacterium]
MQHPVSRVLAMLELLQAHPGMTGPELAVHLRVDERTVRRYATRLVQMGVPVVAERGRHGGYRLVPGHRPPPLMLTGDEITAVVLGLIAARRAGLPLGEAAAHRALTKIERLLPAELRDRIHAAAGPGELGTAGPGTPYRVRVVLGASLEAARRRIPPSAGTLAATPGGEGVLFTTHATRLDEVARLLAGLGWPFRILEPEALRAEVRALADRLHGYAYR